MDHEWIPSFNVCDGGGDEKLLTELAFGSAILDASFGNAKNSLVIDGSFFAIDEAK